MAALRGIVHRSRAGAGRGAISLIGVFGARMLWVSRNVAGWSVAGFAVEFLNHAPSLLVMATIAVCPALLHAARLRRGAAWATKNLLLRLAVGSLVPVIAFLAEGRVRAEDAVPFVIFALGHVAAVEAADFVSASPR